MGKWEEDNCISLGVLLLLSWLWIYIYLSHIQHHYLEQHTLFKLNLMHLAIIEVHKMPVCSHSSVDTHADCRGHNVGMTVCVNYSLHALSGGGNVQQLYTCLTNVSMTYK